MSFVTASGSEPPSERWSNALKVLVRPAVMVPSKSLDLFEKVDGREIVGEFGDEVRVDF